MITNCVGNCDRKWIQVTKYDNTCRYTSVFILFTAIRKLLTDLLHWIGYRKSVLASKTRLLDFSRSCPISCHYCLENRASPPPRHWADPDRLSSLSDLFPSFQIAQPANTASSKTIWGESTLNRYGLRRLWCFMILCSWVVGPFDTGTWIVVFGKYSTVGVSNSLGIICPAVDLLNV